jgi:serralysin
MILENTTAITTVAATDADLPVQTLTYSITGGADAALFTINSSTGSLSFVAAHDYEKPNDAGGDNIYDVTVQASDGTLNVTQAITVTILPFNDNNPEITSPNHFSIPENTTVITTLAVTDADRPAEDLTYSIIDGLDKARFSIVSTTGALTFVTAPDFETPADSNTDNIYEVEVQVSDGDHNVTQKISVQVTDVDGH